MILTDDELRTLTGRQMRGAQALELRQLANKFSEGWHDGIKIDASDVMLLADAAAALEQAEPEPLTAAEIEQMNAQWNYEIHGDRTRYLVRMTEKAHGIGEKE